MKTTVHELVCIITHDYEFYDPPIFSLVVYCFGS